MNLSAILKKRWGWACGLGIICSGFSFYYFASRPLDASSALATADTLLEDQTTSSWSAVQKELSYKILDELLGEQETNQSLPAAALAADTAVAGSPEGGTSAQNERPASENHKSHDDIFAALAAASGPSLAAEEQEKITQAIMEAFKAVTPSATPDPVGDELTFYDYTSSSSALGAVPAASPTPAAEQGKIVVPGKSALATAPLVPAAKAVGDKERPTVRPTPSPQPVVAVSGHAADTKVRLKAAEIKWENGLGDTNDFEFIPDDDSNERFDDYGRGTIEFQHRLNNTGVRRGVIIKHGFVPTSVNLVLESGEIVYQIPLARFELWTKFQEEYKFFEKAGLLIDLEENIDEITIDAPFAKALYLDENFQVTTASKAYRYVWFLGVRPGNVQIAYRTFDNHETAQTILLKSDENHFLVSELRKGKSATITFRQRHLLSTTPQELDLTSGDISYFNFDLKLEQIGPNALKYQRPQLPLGMREYFLINYLPDTMAGTQRGYLELPGKEFQEQIYRDLGLDGRDGRCVAQINLPKKAFQIGGSASNGIGPLPLSMFFLDRDGVLRAESSEQTQYVLLTSEGLGSINLKVIYFDGSVDFLATFCVPQTYFIEQL